MEGSESECGRKHWRIVDGIGSVFGALCDSLGPTHPAQLISHSYSHHPSFLSRLQVITVIIKPVKNLNLISITSIITLSCLHVNLY